MHSCKVVGASDWAQDDVICLDRQGLSMGGWPEDGTENSSMCQKKRQYWRFLAKWMNGQMSLALGGANDISEVRQWLAVNPQAGTQSAKLVPLESIVALQLLSVTQLLKRKKKKRRKTSPEDLYASVMTWAIIRLHKGWRVSGLALNRVFSFLKLKRKRTLSSGALTSQGNKVPHRIRGSDKLRQK